MKTLRQLLWFVVGILLSAWVVVAYAETIPATSVSGAIFWVSSPRPNELYSSPTAACNGSWQTDPSDAVATASVNIFKCVRSGATFIDSGSVAATCTATLGVSINSGVMSCPGKYSCPDGKNWTLSGNTCTRPDCKTLRLSNGQCADSCTSGTVSEDVISGANPLSAPSTYCLPSNCAATYLSAGPVGYQCSYGASGFGFCKQGYRLKTVTSGGVCDYETNTIPKVPEKIPETDNKDKCPSGSGIASASSGFVRCLPPGASPETVKKTETIDPANPSAPPVVTESKDPTVSKTECLGSICTKTESKVGADGKVETIQTVQGKDVFCENNPNNAQCKGATGGSGGAGSSMDGTTHFNTPGAGEFGSKQSDIDLAKQAITDELNTIKNQAKSLLGKLTTGGGALPCGDGIQVLGQTFKLCVSQYSSQLSPVPSAIILMGALAALFIIFR